VTTMPCRARRPRIIGHQLSFARGGGGNGEGWISSSAGSRACTGSSWMWWQSTSSPSAAAVSVVVMAARYWLKGSDEARQAVAMPVVGLFVSGFW